MHSTDAFLGPRNIGANILHVDKIDERIITAAKKNGSNGINVPGYMSKGPSG